MPHTFTVLLHPASASDTRADWSQTWREVSLDTPALRVGELSSQRGDGIFETLGLVNGHVQEQTAHLERLAHSARISDLPEPNLDQWRAAITHAAEQLPRTGEFSVRIVLSRGVENGPAPTAWLVAQPATDHRALREHGLSVVCLDRGYDRDTAARAPWLLLGAKTLSYAVNMAAMREARRRGAGDALFVSSDGYVLEAPTASLIIRRAGGFETPAPSGAILHGTTQQSVFSWLSERGHRVEYRDIPLAHLDHVEAAWLVSSVRLAVPITAIDGHTLPVDTALTGAMNAYLLSPRD